MTIPSDVLPKIIYAVVVIAYLAFVAFVVWRLSDKVPGTMGRLLVAVGAVMAGLPPILFALGAVMGG
ncbi:hypothetical protein GCM10022243_63930 [Saccharothrix violaceirubra]|uniref:Phosphoglycerol transferase MdoB-like AlkP superfamily enzyme n=1 Tax=Saccharothrix violaceirubra TaxID=413306 RepID=A0A7W7WZA9_9PSEU|nr:hypothetical protein [Saccharothrix violaceirubra]MBB4969122.1 phosphoglycerol transferase MdoB-like AlkP superfamily enzyme [Saccharothrix violaceirubra]